MKEISNVLSKTLLFFLIVLLILVSGSSLWAADVLVNMRFYEGVRSTDPGKPSVVTSFYVEPYFVGNIVTETGLAQETAKLKRIFNVSNVKLLTQAHWTWLHKQPRKIFRAFVLNGRKFGLLLTRPEKKNRFRIEVYEGKEFRDKEKNLLDTEIILKPKNTAIFGFETPGGEIYFLSLHREMDTEIVEEDLVLVSTQYRPQLIHPVRPEYPQEAVKKGIEGWVRLQGFIDKKGKVMKIVNIISGPPELTAAAVAAVRQWRYLPPTEKEKTGPLPLPFTAVISFRLPGDQGKDKSTEIGKTAAGRQAVIPNIWPARGYISLSFGPARNPFTGKEMFHNGIDIVARAGSPVTAPADGTVTLAGLKGDFGNLIILDHGSGYITRYAHLQSIQVEKGDRVKRGDIIGKVGNSGKSTGSHLHYEVRLNDKPVNPINLIENK